MHQSTAQCCLQHPSRSAQGAEAQRAQAVRQNLYWKLLMLLISALHHLLQLSRCHHNAEFLPHLRHLQD